MISALMKYSAVIAKVRGMRGKLLTPADWRRLCDMGDVDAVYNFLRVHPGYERALASVGALGAAENEEEALIEVLRHVEDREFERIFSYAASIDKEYLLFAVRRFELLEILAALRRLIARHPETPAALPAFFAEKSKINVPALRSANDLLPLMIAVQGSIYNEPLAAAPLDPDTGLPDYTQASILLENRYYAVLYSFLRKRYQGIGRANLAAGVGLEADIINIVSIIRLRRYFPGSFDRALELLLPIGHRLPPALRRALVEAPSEEAMFAVLRPTRWGRYFDELGDRPVDYVFEKAMEDFSTRLLHSANPSICVPQAYLTLRGIEIKRLVRVIKALTYGRDPARFL